MIRHVARSLASESRICMSLRSAGLVPENRRRRRKKTRSRYVNVINDPAACFSPLTKGGWAPRGRFLLAFARSAEKHRLPE